MSSSIKSIFEGVSKNYLFLVYPHFHIYNSPCSSSRSPNPLTPQPPVSYFQQPVFYSSAACILLLSRIAIVYVFNKNSH